MTSAPEVEANLAAARGLLERARAQGAVLAALPENFAIMGRKKRTRSRSPKTPAKDRSRRSSATARASWGCGSSAARFRCASTDEPARVAAASLVFDERGRCVARYDKIHLFDVDIPGPRGTLSRIRDYRARRAAHGRVDTARPPRHGGVLRRALSGAVSCLQAQGAEVLSLPSAFTAPTGRAHWELLVRARAVENLCYVLAPAQSGTQRTGAKPGATR